MNSLKIKKIIFSVVENDSQVEKAVEAIYATINSDKKPFNTGIVFGIPVNEILSKTIEK